MAEDEQLFTLPEHAKLADVRGCSHVASSALAVDEISGQTAYAAGSTVVIVKNRRQAHLVSTSKNTFTSLAFSPCGRYLATGESGNNPSVRIWHVLDDDGRFVGAEIRQLRGHSFGIVAVAFAAIGHSHLVSVGNQHDKTISVWDWRTGTRLTSSKINYAVCGIAMSPDGSFATFGAKHVKLWHFQADRNQLHGRSAILGDKRSCHFSAGVFVDEHTLLAIADNSFIVELHNKQAQNTYRFGEKRLYSLALLSESTLLVGCDSGVVLACSLGGSSMEIEWTFPLPHHVGMDPAQATHDSAFEPANHPQNAIYPDVRALSVHPSSQTASVLYADRSLYVWKRRGDESVLKLLSEISHVGGVNVVEVYPSHLPFLPSGTFVTGGVDGTIRFWNTSKDQQEEIIQTTLLPTRNVYSDTLKKVIFTSEDARPLVENFDDDSMVPSTRLDSDVAVKSLRFSPDGRHLAIGKQNGNFLVLDIAEMMLIQDVDAHDSDIFALEYYDSCRGGPSFFATGGRDRIVHLFSPAHGYRHIATFMDHQSGVIAIKFATTNDGTIRMFTLGTDKAIVIWNHNMLDAKTPFVRATTITPGVAMTDMALMPELTALAVGCADKQIRVFSLSGKPICQFTAVTDRSGSGTTTFGKISFDPSGTLVAAISDKLIHVIDIRSQKVLFVLPGCGDTPTHVAFSADLRNIIVCGSNGCIYTWRLSSRQTNRLHLAARELRERIESRRVPTPDSVLGSGSDCVSEEQPLGVDRGETLSAGGSTFGSVDSIHFLAGDFDSSNAFTINVGTKQGLEVEKRAEAVVRHSTTNLHGAESNLDITSEQDPREERSERAHKQYTPSKSMSNIRLPMHSERTDSPRKPRSKWAVEPQNNNDTDFNSSTLLAGLIEGSRGGSMGPSGNNENVYAQPYGGALGPNNGYAGTSLSLQQRNELNRSPASPISRGVLSANGVRSPFSRNDAGRVSLSKSFLNKGLAPTIAPEAKPAATVWSPQNHSSSRRTISNVTPVGTPSGAVASAITRRQSAAVRPSAVVSSSATSEKIRRSRTFGRMKDIQQHHEQDQKTSSSSQRRPALARPVRKAEDYSSSPLHLRSRSQSPNHLIQNGLLTTPKRRDSDMSLAGASPLAASSRLTSSRSNLSTQPEAIRKSNQALDKLANMRSKLRQSTENIMGDGEDASSTPSTSVVSRSKSIGNLRNGAQLEAFGTFDADEGAPRRNSSLMHSRLLARSMGNVSAAEETQPSSSRPSAQLAQHIQMLKKASNPDLTQTDLYDENTSFQERILNRRGAVQKRVERYHPRNRTAGGVAVRTGTSEESDSNSNTSDASPLNASLTTGPAGRRYFGVAGNRSSSSVEGARGGSRRLFESRHGSSMSSAAGGSGSTPTRRSNYLASKLAGDGDVAPDMGSDETARGTADLMAQLDGAPEQDRNMALHVDQALEQAMIAFDKALCAEKLLRDAEVNERTRDALNDRCVKVFQQMSSRLVDVLARNGVSAVNGRHSTDDSLRHDIYNANSASMPAEESQTPVDLNFFLSQHGPQLMELLKHNLAKSN